MIAEKGTVQACLEICGKEMVDSLAFSIAFKLKITY